jgi:TolB-like protein
MPFDNATNDSTLGVIGRMAADYITEGLSGLTTVEVVATNAAFAVSGRRPARRRTACAMSPTARAHRAQCLARTTSKATVCVSAPR